MTKSKGPCVDCNDTGVLRIAGVDREIPCYCSATGEKARPSAKRGVQSGTAPRTFRGVIIRPKSK